MYLFSLPNHYCVQWCAHKRETCFNLLYFRCKVIRLINFASSSRKSVENGESYDKLYKSDCNRWYRHDCDKLGKCIFDLQNRNFSMWIKSCLFSIYQLLPCSSFTTIYDFEQFWLFPCYLNMQMTTKLNLSITIIYGAF